MYVVLLSKGNTALLLSLNFESQEKTDSVHVGDGQRNTETMKWNKSNRHMLYLVPFAIPAFFFSILAISLYLNEHHSVLWRDGASVIHHRQDTCREMRTGQ